MLPVVVINLPRCAERADFMRRQLARYGLAGTWIDAVDGKTLPLPNPHLVDEIAFGRRHHAYLRRGEIGCYLSHVAALREIIRSQADAGIVLEDDVELPADFVGLVDELMACADDWDLVKLHVTHPSGIITRRQLRNGRKLVSLAFRHGSAAAYLVNRAATQKLIAGLLPMTIPFDHEFDRSWKYGFRLRVVLPVPTVRKAFPSTIIGSDPIVEARKLRPVNVKMHKPWHQQAGMVLFRGSNDIARVLHELRRD